MANLKENAAIFVTTKADIKNALAEKGVVTDGGLVTYADAIRRITTENSCRIILPETVSATAVLDGNDITETIVSENEINISNYSGDLVIRIAEKKTVTYNLVNISSSSSIKSLPIGAAYTTTLTPSNNYEITSININMGGTDITNDVYTDGVVTIANVTDDIVITATASLITYSITNNLVHVTSNNRETNVGKGYSYLAIISPDEYYELSDVTIEMGGVDITNESYNDGVITIGSVIGDIVITASATRIVYTVANTLSHVVSNNANSTVDAGASYNAIITAEEGYDLESVSVTMGSETIVVMNGIVNIPVVTDNINITASGVIKTFTITNFLTHVTSNNNASNINYGETYSAVISPETNYMLDSVRVEMGGTDITEQVNVNGVITINSVTGNIIIVVNAIPNSVSVVYNFTGVESSNSASETPYGEAYVATLSASRKNYAVNSITVTMGGVDITDSVVDGVTINIPNVTGTIIITATSSKAKDIGTVSTTNNAITINDGELSAGTYTLRYEDIDGNPIANEDDITTFTI